METEPTTLNPQLNGQNRTHLILRNAYESLLYRDSDGGYVPWLADSYEVSSDARQFTFTLREDVTFSDGEPLTAAAVKVNFDHLNDPTYDENGAGQGPLAHLEEVVVIDERTVRFDLVDSFAPFLDYASNAFLISPSSYEEDSISAGGSQVHGTGPFVISDVASGQEVTFERRDDYDWAPANAGHQGPAYLDSVTYRFLPESSVRIGALTSEQVDVIEGIPGIDSATLSDNDEVTVARSSLIGAPWSIYFNTIFGPTQDESVRKAFVAAVDVDTILDSIYQGERTRAWSSLNASETQFYQPALEGSFGNDPDLANELLDAAGWSGRDDEGFRTNTAGERLTITLFQGASYVFDGRDTVLQAVQAQVKDVAGIDFDVQQVDDGTWAEHYVANDYGALDNAIIEPGSASLQWHWLPKELGGAVNFSNIDEDQVTTWLTQGWSTPDVATRAAIYQDLQTHVVAERAYVLPLVESEAQVATRDHVHGFRFRPYYNDPESAYDIWLDPAS
ncbi:ABC transporter substrate-binding protein [Aeromicrobium alkaliterrae]|uniref:ABC transporter substrate-binding protein n=1 Tax=Aeromicrobium alkaliterrae TaxID=302168 RepID=UPI0031DCEE5C